MTIRLYYADSYLKEFSGVAVAQCRVDEKPAIILNQTAFYPTSGGQPFDKGVLGTAQVLDVIEDSSGKILHVLDSVLPLGPVSGIIDWIRRFDHMQQHTGQHILSQAFLQVAQAPTVSFHMGLETCTIDLELAHPSVAVMQEVEELASRIVFEDRPVHVRITSSSDIDSLGLRKQSEREGEIRIIDVEGFDRTPCGGTHVRRSGEIGLISVLGYERYKGGTRVEFVCGGRALRTLRKDHEALKILAKLHSAHPYDLPRVAEKFFLDRSSLIRENARLQEELLEHEAQKLVVLAEQASGFIVVRKIFEGRSLESMKMLAQMIVSRGGIFAILSSVQEAAQVVLARSMDVPGDCGAVVKKIVAEHGGKGGGKPELAQAGGIPADRLQEWLQAAEKHFRALT